ncbi:MAG: tRNA pseudouridine synthase A [Thermoguttaceae bacterium]|nr:tRNA pseudouridine synthase A [Thermoguttaceae bacterium]MDW8038783.1 tRNA pseudouridine synthase A [Thermoguttaceae bacterium]
MPIFKIIVAYDGTEFSGWQIQPNQRTVQGVLEVVLRQLTGQSVRVWGASRTDAGVHALGQVAAFSLNTQLTPEELLRGINALLPPDVVVLQLEEASPRFWPSRDATAKRYRYVIYDGPIRHIFLRRYAWQIDQRLDAAAMHQAAQSLVGTHDFASFQSARSPRPDTIRTLFEVSVRRCPVGQGELWLWQMPYPTIASAPEAKGPETELSCLEPSAQESLLPSSDFGQLDAGRLPEERAGQGGQSATAPLSSQTVRPSESLSVGPEDPSTSSLRPTTDGDLVIVEVEGDGFLYHMVRAIVGTLVEVGRGNRPPEWVAKVLEARNRSAAGKTAPPEGLYLLRVRFDLPVPSCPQPRHTGEIFNPPTTPTPSPGSSDSV